MKIFPILSLFLFALLPTSMLFAQEKMPENKKPIEAKFEKVMDRSSNYKNYEVVRQDLMIDLRDSTIKRIESLNAEIEKHEQTIKSLNEEVSGLKSKISSIETELKTANEEKASISFFGAPIEKSAYKGIMWGIIIFLGAFLAFFVYRFRNSDVLTKEAQKNLAETEAEFEEFRQKSLEKQQEMGRKLQDERNKRSKMV
jgi:hypothetical protein